MRTVVTLLLIAGLIQLSSCGDGTNDNLAVVPSIKDSVSKGSNVYVHFNDLVNDSKDFVIYDYKKQDQPVYALYASTVYNATDSLYHCRLQLMDHKKQQLAFKLELTNTSAGGTFQVVANSSTLTDYSKGQDIIYAVSLGSTVNVTKSSYPMEGTFNLNLYYNHKTIPATGNFKIYP